MKSFNVKKVGTLLLVTVLTSVMASTSFANNCSEIPTMERQLRIYKMQHQDSMDISKSFSEIAGEATGLGKKSQILAITSASLLLAAIGAYSLPIAGSSSIDFSFTAYAARGGPLAAAYIESVKARVMLGILPGALIAHGATGIGSFTAASAVAVTGLATMPFLAAIATAEIWYPLGVGIYEFQTEKGKIQIDLEDLKKTEPEILAVIKNVQSMRAELIDSPPSALKNALKFGGPNQDHFQKIANLAEFEVQLNQSLVNLKSIELKTAKGYCANPN